MERDALRADILARALPLAAFDGWSMPTLRAAAAAGGHARAQAGRAFPGGAVEAAESYLRLADDTMTQAMQGYHLETMKIRERATLAVRTWLTGQEPHREALRRALALLAMPFHSHRALAGLFHTSDALWRAIGDQSSDFSYYTRRLTLSGVFSSTLLFWLEDHSPGHQATWDFLDRRIDEVMRFEAAKRRVRDWAAKPRFTA